MRDFKGGNRKYWVYYDDSKSQMWMKQILAHYFQKFVREKREFDFAGLCT